MRGTLAPPLLAALAALAILAPSVAGAQDDAVDGEYISIMRERVRDPNVCSWGTNVYIDELGYTPDHGMGLSVRGILFDGVINKIDIPNTRHSFDLSGTIYSELRREVDFRYDFNLMRWRGVHIAAGAHYEADPMAGFHGFGGASSPYYRELDRRGGVAFYGISRDVARASVELDGNVADWGYGRKFGGNIDWNASASLADYKIGNVTYKKYADGADNSLYNLYRKYGIVSDAEAAGGRRAEFGVGLTYRGYRIPIRNRASYVSAEVGVRVSPDLFDRRADYAKLSARFFHNIAIVRNPHRVQLIYSLGYDGTVWSQGSVPFYVASELAAPLGETMPAEGELGGQGTLRGAPAGRVVGDGVVWGGVDLTVDATWFALFGKLWRVSPSVFVDAGAVVQPFRLDETRDVWNNTRLPAAERRLIYSGLDEKIHATAGLGVTVHNAAGWSVHALWGKPFARQDGPGAVYAGVKWRF